MNCAPCLHSNSQRWRRNEVKICVFSFPLTFLHHACSHSELGGVVGGSVAFHLPGLLLGYYQQLPLLDGHVRIAPLALRLRISYSLRSETGGGRGYRQLQYKLLE